MNEELKKLTDEYISLLEDSNKQLNIIYELIKTKYELIKETIKRNKDVALKLDDIKETINRDSHIFENVNIKLEGDKSQQKKLIEIQLERMSLNLKFQGLKYNIEKICNNLE